MEISVYKKLGKELSTLGLLHYYDDIVANFTGPQYENQLHEWNIEMLQKWVESMKFLGDESYAYGERLAGESGPANCIFSCDTIIYVYALYVCTFFHICS